MFDNQFMHVQGVDWQDAVTMHHTSACRGITPCSDTHHTSQRHLSWFQHQCWALVETWVAGAGAAS